jgi:hypothetical protein
LRSKLSSGDVRILSTYENILDELSTILPNAFSFVKRRAQVSDAAPAFGRSESCHSDTTYAVEGFGEASRGYPASPKSSFSRPTRRRSRRVGRERGNTGRLRLPEPLHRVSPINITVGEVWRERRSSTPRSRASTVRARPANRRYRTARPSDSGARRHQRTAHPADPTSAPARCHPDRAGRLPR